MKYTGDGQIVHLFDPNGVKQRVRVPLFGGDVVHVNREYDEKTGRLKSETVALTSVATEAGWSWDEPQEKPKPKKK